MIRANVSMSPVRAVVDAVREHIHQARASVMRGSLAERYARALRELDMSIFADDAERIVHARCQRRHPAREQHLVEIASDAHVPCSGFTAELMWWSDRSTSPFYITYRSAFQVLRGWVLDVDPARSRMELLHPGAVRVATPGRSGRQLFAVDGDALLIRLYHEDERDATDTDWTDSVHLSGRGLIRPVPDAWQLRHHMLDPALRFFLAALALVPDRATLLQVLAARHGGDPMDTLIDRMARLGPHLWHGSGDDVVERRWPALAGARLCLIISRAEPGERGGQRDAGDGEIGDDITQEWQIHFEDGGPHRRVRLRTEDGELYACTDIPERRDSLLPGERFIACNVHFVPATTTG